MAEYALVNIEELEADLIEVGDAIRYKTGITERIPLKRMPGEIRSITGGIPNVEDDALRKVIEGGELNLSMDSVSNIRDNAFYRHEGLKTAIFPNCKSIGAYAFDGCPLMSISFPSCEYVDEAAFAYCQSLQEVKLPVCTNIGNQAFVLCQSLTSVNLPNCRFVDTYAFGGCASLKTIKLPVCGDIAEGAFEECLSLETIDLPLCHTIGSEAFGGCASLKSVNLSVCMYIDNNAFADCTSLTTLVLGGSSVPHLMNSNAFSNTPMFKSSYTGQFGSIYVPAYLVSAYKTAANWNYYSSRITAIT